MIRINEREFQKKGYVSSIWYKNKQGRLFNAYLDNTEDKGIVFRIDNLHTVSPLDCTVVNEFYQKINSPIIQP